MVFFVFTLSPYLRTLLVPDTSTNHPSVLVINFQTVIGKGKVTKGFQKGRCHHEQLSRFENVFPLIRHALPNHLRTLRASANASRQHHLVMILGSLQEVATYF